MNEKIGAAKPAATSTVVTGEFASQVNLALGKSRQLQRPFFCILLQLDGLDGYRRRRSSEDVNKLLRDIYGAVRRAVHASQYVGIFRNGLGMVFDAADPGQVDLISRRLLGLVQQTIRNGRYNDLSSRWSDILYQFLSPAGGGVLMAQVGWAIYPRDGESASDLIKRAWHHLLERSR